MLWYCAYPNDKFPSRVISNPTADNSFSLIKGDTFEKCLFQDPALPQTHKMPYKKGKIFFIAYLLCNKQKHLFKIILK